MDINNENYYCDTNKLIDLISNLKTDYHTDINTLKNQEAYSYAPFWPVPKGFNGPPQMVGYSINDNKAIIAVHASRENFDFNGDIMHNKFFIIDNQKIWTGSTNASDTGTGGYNANIACIINNEDLAKLYLAEFEQMYINERFHNNKTHNDEENNIITFEKGTIISTYFSPQSNTLEDAVYPLIRNSKNNINISIFYLTHKGLTAELIKAHNRGVDVRIILDATAAGNGYTKHEILREVGVSVKVENWGGKMHMKSATIDDEYLILGSMNFTTAGADSNDENTLIIHNAYYAKEFNTFFENMWDNIPNNFLKEDPTPESKYSTNSLSDGVDNDYDDLIDSDDDSNPINPELPPYKVVPKTDGYNLIKGIENKNGFMIYILPNDKYYEGYLVNKSNEGYFPSILEATEAGFERFNYKKHILMK